MTDFNKELAIALFNSNDQFPVDLDDAWQELGFSNKASAKRLLSKLRCGVDYIVEDENTGKNGRPREIIRLTTDCYKKIIVYRETKRSQVFSEKVIREKLHTKKSGQIEVSTPAGVIDLLTCSEIIEIKNVKNWKSAMGQVLAYGFYYPSHQKVICLFGYAHSSFKEMVEKICNENGVFVEWMGID